MTVVVLDYGSGNLRSAERALARAGADVTVTADLDRALGEKRGLRRFADAAVPLDEALVQVAVDLSGRPYLVHSEPDGMPPTVGPLYATTLTRHVFESFAHNARIALHVRVLGGRDAHHIVEAQFKAVARALRDATARDPKVEGIPSTKGVL